MNFNKNIIISNKEISEKSSVFVIAEAGVNHNGDIEIAKQLINIAVEAKADAIKFQAFKTDNLVLKNVSKAPYQLKNGDIHKLCEPTNPELVTIIIDEYAKGGISHKKLADKYGVPRSTVGDIIRRN